MPTGLEEAGLALSGISILVDQLSQLRDKLLDPALNDALGPQSALTVNPFYFQSVETEGRWKRKCWGFNEPRDLINQRIKEPADVAKRPAWDPTSTDDLNMKDLIPSKLLLMKINVGASLDPAISARISTVEKLAPVSSAAIEVRWWSDGLEIWGGMVYLNKASGFGSMFGHRANVEVGGTVMGNYLPAKYMIGLTGWVNPVGPRFVQFNIGFLLSAQTANGFKVLWKTAESRDEKDKIEVRQGENGSVWLDV